MRRSSPPLAPDALRDFAFEKVFATEPLRDGGTKRLIIVVTGTSVTYRIEHSPDARTVTDSHSEATALFNAIW